MITLFRITILITFFSVITSDTISQEWELINPQPTTEYLLGVHFLNPDTGFVCVQFCTLLRTTDGGETWEENDTLTYGRFLAISFLNNDTGFVVGGNSILRTNDCGENWITMGPHLGVGYNDIFFLDDSNGWVVGDYNTVIRTHDGGNNWEVLSHSIGIQNFYYRVIFTTPDTGYACGRYGHNGWGILKMTDDGGESWDELPVPFQVDRIRGLEILEGNDIYISCHNDLYHTLDFGQTWEQIQVGTQVSFIEQIEFIDSVHWKVMDGHALYNSNDGGQTWDTSNFIVSHSFKDMFWLNSSYCYVVGSGGVIINSFDSGNIWNEVSQGFRPSFKDVSFIDENTGIAVGSSGDEEEIYRTVDGGLNWSRIISDTLHTHYYLTGIDMEETGIGWICAGNYLLKSVDAGILWTYHDPGFSYGYKDIDVYQEKYIWTGGSGGKLIRSKDYGNSWDDISLSTSDHIEIICFSDSLNGLLTLKENKKTGYTLLYRTIDGGDTWQEIIHPGGICPIINISHPDMNTIYLTVGYHGLLKSLDGGITWDYIGEINGVMPTYVKFTDPEAGIISATDYYVAHTWDGGESWIIDLDKSSSPHGLGISETYFYDFQHAWMVGINGLIKRYYNPDVFIPEEHTTENISKVIIYPNPVQEKLSILNVESISEVRIFNIEGKLVHVAEGDMKAGINMENLTRGAYIIEITTRSETHSAKFIKK